jgi:hypothetical protein
MAFAQACCCPSVGLETSGLVAAITKGFLFRCTAAAQKGLFALPSNTSASGTNSQVALDHQRAIWHGFDIERTTGAAEARSFVAERAKILKTGLQMAIVAKWLVVRCTTTAECRAILHASHVWLSPIDIQLAGGIHWSVIDQCHRILVSSLLRLAMLIGVTQGTAWAALADFADFGATDFIGYTPGIAITLEECVVGVTAFTDMYAQAFIPVHIDLVAREIFDRVVAHGQLRLVGWDGCLQLMQ